jgi:hypothetical protein
MPSTLHRSSPDASEITGSSSLLAGPNSDFNLPRRRAIPGVSVGMNKFFKQAGRTGEKFQHHSGALGCRRHLCPSSSGITFLENAQGRVNLPALPFFRHDPEHVPTSFSDSKGPCGRQHVNHRTIPQPVIRELVLTLERATDNVVRSPSACSALGENEGGHAPGPRCD